MPNPIIGLAGASAIGGVASASAQRKAASSASDAQVRAAQLSVDEQRRQFDAAMKLLQPYAEGGTDAYRMMADLAGVSGADAQREQIDLIQQSPELAARIQMGEEALLQNAAATGGLRGGNTAAALAQFRPQMLAEQIGTQYGRLSGLAQIGQGAAAGQVAAGQNLAAGVSNAYGQMGSAQAGAALARGAATQNMWSGITGGIGSALGMGGLTPPAGAGMFDKWGF